MNTDFDCIVIGGGPSGSTVGTLVAMQGHKTLVLERARFPRFHIGESLLPETYWVFKRLGMLPKLKASHFVKKYSVQFANAMGKESQPFYFDEVNPHESSQTWQVLRSEFDQMMLENAAEHGATVWQEANVNDVLLEPGEPGRLPRARGVVVTRAGQAAQNLTAKIVVDATGTSALLSKKLGIRKKDPSLRKVGVFAHYKGARRDTDKNAGATLVLATPNQDGWFWVIPLHDDITSVGVVGDAEYLIQGRGAPEETLAAEIARTPSVATRLTHATRVSPVHVLQDYTYRSDCCAGDGWVLVGDAFGFLDPIYSSGVFLALKTGEMAADCINDALARQEHIAERLGRWGQPLYEGMHLMRKLVYAYYTRGFSFGQFMRRFPQEKKPLVDLLVGDWFKPGAADIFQSMEQMIPLPEFIPLKLPGKLDAPVNEAAMAG